MAGRKTSSGKTGGKTTVAKKGGVAKPAAKGPTGARGAGKGPTPPDKANTAPTKNKVAKNANPVSAKKAKSSNSSAKGDGGERGLSVRVKTARRRTLSSTLWLHRQLNDPYVVRAQKDGYRSRAAYKLLELEDRFHMLKSGMRVLDLGAAPGGWTQVAVARCGKGRVLGVDLKEIEPITGAELIVQDFLEDDAPDRIRTLLGGNVDAVLSDMAANASGQTQIDHIRIITLCELAAEFAFEMLNEGGCFVAKVLKGGTESELLKKLRKHFTLVKHAKPAASRKDSAESYVVATGFKGRPPAGE